MSDIDKDLVRWNRGKWIAVTLIAFGLQLALIVTGSQQAVKSRKVYPRDPRVALGGDLGNVPLIALEDPFLFASASSNGFSAEAWLKRPSWVPPETGRPLGVSFLNYTEAEEIIDSPSLSKERFAFADRPKPRPNFPQPREQLAPQRESKFRIKGLENRILVSPIELPTQYHTDVLRPTVVETLVGADGLTLTAVVVENSGSPKADNDALRLARTARFSPQVNGDRSPEIAKLIFEWIALDLSHTNNVQTTR